MKTLYDTIAEFISGDWGCEAESDSATQSGYCIRAADIIPIETHDYSTIPQRFVSQSSFDQRHLIKGDIVIEKSGGSPTQSTGRAVYISQSLLSAKRNIICSNFCTAIRLKPEWNPYFIYQYWRQVYNSGVFFNYEGKTSGLKNLQLEVALKSIPIPEIDLPTQLRIAGILGSLDEKIELNRKKIAELEALVKTIYDYWFVQFDFPDKNGKPYKSSGGKMVWNEQLKREIPAGWETCTIGQLCHCHDSKRVPLSGKQRIEMEGDIPYYGATGVMDYVDKYIFDGEYLLFAEDGSVMTEDGFPILQIINGKTWVNNHAHVLSPRIKCSVKFLQLHFQNIPVRKIKTGSIQPKVTKENLFSFKVLSIPTTILCEADNILDAIQKRIEISEQTVASLTHQRDALIPLLMNGQVKVVG